MSEILGPTRTGRSLGKWKDYVKEYMCARVATRKGGLQQKRKEIFDRERWRRLFCCVHPLGGCYQRK